MEALCSCHQLNGNQVGLMQHSMVNRRPIRAKDESQFGGLNQKNEDLVTYFLKTGSNHCLKVLTCSKRVAPISVLQCSSKEVVEVHVAKEDPTLAVDQEKEYIS